MVGIGVAVIAPPGMVMRIPLSAPILLYLTWYVMSKAWAYDQVWWMRIARREVPMTVAMIVVAARSAVAGDRPSHRRRASTPWSW